MMKFIMVILFMNFMIMFSNFMVIFYYNLCYLFSLIMIFTFMFKDVSWFNMTLSFGCNYYSLMLVLSFWILGLIYEVKKMFYYKWKINNFGKYVISITYVFLSIDLILFYLLFEISLIPTFFLVIYWGTNPERVESGYYMMMYMLLVFFPLLVYIFSMYMYVYMYMYMYMYMYTGCGAKIRTNYMFFSKHVLLLQWKD